MFLSKFLKIPDFKKARRAVASGHLKSDSMAAAVEWMYSDASPGDGWKASC
jgi:hypothetical protein